LILIISFLSWSGISAEAPSFKPESFAYVLQADRLHKDRRKAVELLRSCKRDLLILDHTYDGSAEAKWTAKEIRYIRACRPLRKIVSYISIGEAENYRTYWEKDWDANHDGRPGPSAPDYLLKVNPDWEGNYKVRYWDKRWQGLIMDYVDEIIELGFDGLYLDIVDGFEFFEREGDRQIDHRKNPATGNTYRQDMIGFVQGIAAHVRKTKGQEFVIIPQNGAQLLKDPGYLRVIDAIGIEDLFTDGDRKADGEHVRFMLSFLKKMEDAGKPVLVVEYPKKRALKKHAVRRAEKQDFVLLLTERELGSLGDR
jgi:cysteinyl-tRNA synthetase